MFVDVRGFLSIFGPPWAYFGVTLGSLWGHFGVTLGHFGVTLGHFGVTSESLRGLSGVTLGLKSENVKKAQVLLLLFEGSREPRGF